MANNKLKLLLVLLLAVLATSCAGADQSAATEAAAQESIEYSNIVAASGKVMPVRWAEVGLETGGRLLSVVEEGTQVSAADELARVEAGDLQQAVAQAEAALASAEAHLALAQAGARSEDVDAADGSVQVAQGRVTAAKGGLEQTKSNSGTAVKTAEAQLAQAKAEVNRAYAELALLQSGTRSEEIAMYQARVNQAQSDFLIAENLHFEGFIDPGVGGGAEERARYTRESARGARDAAQAQLNLANAGSNPQAIAAAAAVVAAMQAQVDMAEAALEQAQATSADVTVAQAQIQIASGELAQAEAAHAKLNNGSTAQEIAVLEAEVGQAEAALTAAEAALDRTRILAPFDGIIGNLLFKSGEVVTPGTPILVLGDTSSLRVETTDLNEVDAAQVNLDDKVTLTFDALPSIISDGRLVRISPMASAGQGGTNFTAVIELIDPPDALRWGMTAFVDIEVD